MNADTESQTFREMPRYKCHKEVHALKIKAIDMRGDGGADITPEDNGFAPFIVDAEWLSRFYPGESVSGEPLDLGYYVLYADGYKSWSPTKAFEEGYTRMT